MALRDLGFLAWPSPLLEEGAELDPIAEITAGSGGRVDLKLLSGESARATFTSPGEGILRLRIGEPAGTGPTSMLVEFNDRPVTVGSIDGGVSIEGAGAHASWVGGNFSFGNFRSAPAQGSIPGRLSLSTGRLGRDGSPGWVQTAWLAPEAGVYGGGESFQGPNLRGRLRRLINSEALGVSGLDFSYLNVPFLWSDAGWGIFVHSAGPVRADLGSTHSEVAAVTSEGDHLDLFFFTGDPVSILRSYLSVTGMPGPFPDWALGVWMSRCSYLSGEEVLSIVEELQEAECPVDVIHVDAWLEGNLLAELTCQWKVDRKRFSKGWTAPIKHKGVRVSLWHNPYVMSGTEVAADLESRGLLALDPEGKPAITPDLKDRFLLDFTKPEAVDWWKQNVRRVLREEGNDAFKPDFAEEVPFGSTFGDGRTGRQLRNEYANLYQRATLEAMREELGEDAVALFCRSGTSGAQRNPCHWVGDTPSTWTGLVTALRACLSLSLSGYAFVAHDVGGFYTPESFQTIFESFKLLDPSSFKADVEPELFVRWSQWGALSAVMRYHGTSRREPTAYPEPYRSAAIAACQMRSRLRKYLIEAARVASTQGLPLMRPMVLAYPDDRGARDAHLQYLLGPDILVAPIMEPGGSREFFVPAGKWKAMWGLDDVEGPNWVKVECPLAMFPAFVRAKAEWPFEE